MKLTDPSTLFLILLAMAAVFLLIRTRGRLARQRQQWTMEEAEDRPDDTDPGDARRPGHLPDDLARWEVEMHETARQLSAQLDAKLSLLQSLIVEADRAAARLEEALDRAYPTLPPGSQAESLRPVSTSGRDDLHLPGDAADTQHCDPSEEPPRTTDRTRRHEEIYRLADYGFAPAEIARRVVMPVGEVELILGLREK
jgi:hypothetical protein